MSYYKFKVVYSDQVKPTLLKEVDEKDITSVDEFIQECSKVLKDMITDSKVTGLFISKE
jgi:hypothetical protein